MWGQILIFTIFEVFNNDFSIWQQLDTSQKEKETPVLYF